MQALLFASCAGPCSAVNSPTMLSSSACFRFLVAGILRSCAVMTVNAASTAPAAPRRWPQAPLVDDTLSEPSRRQSAPNTCSTRTCVKKARRCHTSHFTTTTPRLDSTSSAEIAASHAQTHMQNANCTASASVHPQVACLLAAEPDLAPKTHRCNGRELGGISQWRARCVRVHISDVISSQLRAGKRAPHRKRRAAAVSRRRADVVSVTRTAKAADFG